VPLKGMALTMVLVCGLPLSAAAGQWSKTYPVTAQPDVWASMGDGNVRLDVWDEHKIEAVIETVGYEIGTDFKIIESQEGNRVRIEAKFPSGHWQVNVGPRSLTLTLKVPRTSKLDINTGDGDIRAVGAKGDLRFHSGDGSIDARGLDGRLVASTGDGRISVEGRFDLLDLHTGDGSVEAGVAAGSQLSSAWSVSTGDGSVTVRIPDGLKANLDAHTGDGHLTLDVPVTVEGAMDRSHVRGALNGGGATLTVRTGDGSIRIVRN
jgi:hypothetical protein